MSITAKKIAEMLHISEAAVSMALNNKNGVSKETKKQIIDLAIKNDYDFSKKKTITNEFNGNVYLIVYRRNGAVVVDPAFFSELTQGINIELKKHQYSLVIQYVYEGASLEANINELVNLGCRNVILLGTELLEEDFKKFLKPCFNIVLLDNYFNQYNINAVTMNNIEGAFSATKYLIEKTKLQPSYIHALYDMYNFTERKEGFYKAIRQAGLSTSKSKVINVSPTTEGAYLDILEYLNQNEIEKCYFVDNDAMAYGAYKAFNEKGYKIGRDVFLVGFDNIPLASFIEPGLTTINVPKEYMGIMAARRLVELINEKNISPIKIEVSTELIVRKS